MVEFHRANAMYDLTGEHNKHSYAARDISVNGIVDESMQDKETKLCNRIVCNTSSNMCFTRIIVLKINCVGGISEGCYLLLPTSSPKIRHHVWDSLFPLTS